MVYPDLHVLLNAGEDNSLLRWFAAKQDIIAVLDDHDFFRNRDCNTRRWMLQSTLCGHPPAVAIYRAVREDCFSRFTTLLYPPNELS